MNLQAQSLILNSNPDIEQCPTTSIRSEHVARTHRLATVQNQHTRHLLSSSVYRTHEDEPLTSLFALPWPLSPPRRREILALGDASWGTSLPVTYFFVLASLSSPRFVLSSEHSVDGAKGSEHVSTRHLSGTAFQIPGFSPPPPISPHSPSLLPSPSPNPSSDPRDSLELLSRRPSTRLPPTITIAMGAAEGLNNAHNPPALPSP